MNIHLFTLDSEELSPYTRMHIKAFELAFPGQIVIWRDGKPLKEQLLPRMSSTSPAKRFGLFSQPHPDLAAIKQEAKPEDMLVCLSPQVFFAQKSVRDFPGVIHLLVDALAPAQAKIFARQLAKRSDRLILLSRTHQAQLAEFLDGETPAAVVYPAADMQPVEKRMGEQTTFILGCVSPFEKNRGIETVIRALYSVREFLPQLRLVLVGEGSEKGRLQWLVSHLHLNKQVQFVSTGEQYRRFIPHFDALVLADEQPSIWNDDLIAAWINGVPVIASQIGIQRELIQNGQNGLLFEPGNAHMLSQHILNLYNHPEWRQHYKEQGQAFIQEQVSLSAAAKRLQTIFADKYTPRAR